MYTFKAILWFLIALFWVNIIVTANVGKLVKRELERYMGYNAEISSSLLAALERTHVINLSNILNGDKLHNSYTDASGGTILPRGP